MKKYIKPTIELITSNQAILTMSDVKDDEYNPSLPLKAKPMDLDLDDEDEE